MAKRTGRRQARSRPLIDARPALALALLLGAALEGGVSVAEAAAATPCAKTQYPPKPGCYFTCPENSCVRPYRSCVNNFDDCECQEGYVKLLSGSHPNRCVPKPREGEGGCRRQNAPPVEHCEFVCPFNSCAKPGRLCIDSLSDCECKKGYKMLGGKCFKDDYCQKEQLPARDSSAGSDSSDGSCGYRCPQFMCVKPSSASCVRSIDDCECKSGPYYREGDRCLKRGSRSCWWQGEQFWHGNWRSASCQCLYSKWVCKPPGCLTQQRPPKAGCNFECPANSCMKPGRGCLDNINDCECKKGFKMIGDKCFKDSYCQKQQLPIKDSSDGSDSSDSGCNYRCPQNMCVKPGVQCVSDIEDCECKSDDFIRDGGKCISRSCWWEGRKYNRGQRRNNGLCTCRDGKWDCRKVCWWSGEKYNQGQKRNNGLCTCNNGKWQCEEQPKACWWGGQKYNQGQKRSNGLCTCNDGEWACEEEQPKACWWGGQKYNDGIWRGSTCQCSDGTWRCNQQQPPPPQSNNPWKGCIAGLPFGLDNCVCDGTDIGKAVGEASCKQIKAQCQAGSGLVPFKTDAALGAVQKICDALAHDACSNAALNAVWQDSDCKELVANGSPPWIKPRPCTAAQARAILTENVKLVCDPICPGCSRLP